MHYEFPKIQTIDDVLPAIQGRDEFIVIDKDHYKVIDYILQTPDTFPLEQPILRECRGIAFYPNGKIMSRPFHKFFNYGEKTQEQYNIDHPAHVLEKLDGSMIRPIWIRDDKRLTMRLGTRKGITDTAMQAEVFIADKPNYKEFIYEQYENGRTPIFEWCSPRNQIVLSYDTEDLVLLAIRDNVTGHYFEHDYIRSVGKKHHISVVPEFIVPEVPHIKLNDYVDFARQCKEKEGCVIVYPNGHRLKAKGEWYTTIHKAKDLICREKDLIRVWLNGAIDDLLPLLPPKDQEEIKQFLYNLLQEMGNVQSHLMRLFDDCMIPATADMVFSRRDFAMAVQKQEKRYRPFLFRFLDKCVPMEVLKDALYHACRSNPALEENRWLIGGIRFKEKVYGL